MANLTYMFDVRKKMEELGLKESDLYDIFNTGESFKTPNGKLAVRKYYPSYGYEINFTYRTSDYYDSYVITSIWKNQFKKDTKGS